MKYNPPKLSLPRGARDLMPDEVRRRETLLTQVDRICRAARYDRIVTPTFELADALKPGLGPALYDVAFKFFDREGRLMMLRPDLTTPIARLAAGRFMGHKKPLRFFTMGNVFRQHHEGAGREQEIAQIDVELIGEKSAPGDVEVICLGLTLLHRIGIRHARVDVGSVAFLDSVFSKLKLSSDEADGLRRTLRAHNVVEFHARVQKLKRPAAVKEALSALPFLRGPVGRITEFARVLKPLDVAKALNDFAAVAKRVATRVPQSAVTIDFSLIRDFDYYTGTVFEFYQEGFPALLGQGGRYDRLVGRFGWDVSATGFALDVDTLLAGKRR